MHYTHFSDEETKEKLSDFPEPHSLAAAEPGGQLSCPPSILKPKSTLWLLPAAVRWVGTTLGGIVSTVPPPFYLLLLSISRWVIEEWGTCSRSCGKLGVQTRGVQCLLPLSNGTYKAMPAKACSGDRPDARRPCLRVPCPAQWRTGAWSQVSCLQRVGGTGPMGHLLWRVRWVVRLVELLEILWCSLQAVSG